MRKFLKFIPLNTLSPFNHLKSSIIIFASTLAVNIYMHLDVTMTGFICGEDKVGFYTAANRLIRIVIALVTALSAVVVPRLENCLKNGDENSYKKYLNISLNYILILAIPCCFGIIALANLCANVVLPEEDGPAINTIFFSLSLAIMSAMLAIFFSCNASEIRINSAILPDSIHLFNSETLDTFNILCNLS